MLRALSTLAVVGGGAGCDQVFGLEPRPVDAQPAVDANVDDFTAPYTCDLDTLALFHFDAPQLIDACNGSSIINSGAAPITGRSGFGAARMFGEAQYVKTMSTQVVVLTDAFTLDAWVHPTSFTGTGAYRTIAAINNGAPNGRQFYAAVDSMGFVRLTKFATDCFTATPNYGIMSGTSLVLDRWQHLRAGWDGTQFFISIDGAPREVIPEPGGDPTLCGSANEELFVGATGGTGTDAMEANQFFLGAIDELRISRVARRAI